MSKRNWWPDESFTRWERWRIRWYKLGWKALLPWVKTPSSLDTPKTIVFPLIKNQRPEISLTEATQVQPMSLDD